jgi:hypothetical protein
LGSSRLGSGSLTKSQVSLNNNSNNNSKNISPVQPAKRTSINSQNNSNIKNSSSSAKSTSRYKNNILNYYFNDKTMYENMGQNSGNTDKNGIRTYGNSLEEDELMQEEELLHELEKSMTNLNKPKTPVALKRTTPPLPQSNNYNRRDQTPDFLKMDNFNDDQKTNNNKNPIDDYLVLANTKKLNSTLNLKSTNSLNSFNTTNNSLNNYNNSTSSSSRILNNQNSNSFGGANSFQQLNSNPTNNSNIANILGILIVFSFKIGSKKHRYDGHTVIIRLKVY